MSNERISNEIFRELIRLMGIQTQGNTSSYNTQLAVRMFTPDPGQGYLSMDLLSHVVAIHLRQNALGFAGSAMMNLATAKFQGARKTALITIAQNTVTQNTELENRDIELMKMIAGMEQDSRKAVMNYLLFGGTSLLFAEDSPTTILRDFANRLYTDMIDNEDEYTAILRGPAGFQTQLNFVRSLRAATEQFGDESFRRQLSENTAHLTEQFISGQDLIGYATGSVGSFLIEFGRSVFSILQGDRRLFNANNLYTLKEIERHLRVHVPPGDPALVEINNDILTAGQNLYGDSWNRVNFGIGERDIPYAARLSGMSMVAPLVKTKKRRK